MLTDISEIIQFGESYNVPNEDILFMALNLCGISHECNFNRARLEFRLRHDNHLFPLSCALKTYNYYLAIPIRNKSPFTINGNAIEFDGKGIGETIGLTEDICDTSYSRRGGTVLNINPNTRTSCHGCKFCYTAYQVPNDRAKLLTSYDLKKYFDNILLSRGWDDLSPLIQVAVVTGCFDNDDLLTDFILILREVLNEYNSKCEIFYLGSQISSINIMRKVKNASPVGFCFSLECFSKRTDLLRDKKRKFNMQDILNVFQEAKAQGFRTNFSYILGLDSLDIMSEGIKLLKPYINSFPIVNLLQLHKYHPESLRTVGANHLNYYLKARKILENIFADETYRPRPWENYRSPWYLKFGNEILTGCRTP